MMLAACRSALKFGLLFFILPTIVHSAELLRNVDAGAVGSFTSPEKYKLQYGLRSQLYTAKKFRIVEIDFDLLNQLNSEFTITPWEGLSMTVRTLEAVGPGSYTGMQVWRGELMNGGEMMPGSKALPPVNFVMRDLDQMISAKRVKRMQAERNRKPLPSNVFGRLRPADTDTNAMMKMRFRTLRGTMYVPALETYVNIEPIEDDPRYHVIFEVDAKKIALGGESIRPVDVERLQRRKEFERKLTEERVRDLGR